MPTPRSARSQLATDGKPPSTHEMEIEKSTPYPQCYGNLLAGRATNASTSTSPGQPTQPGKPEPREIVDRNFRANYLYLFLQLFQMMKPKYHHAT